MCRTNLRLHHWAILLQIIVIVQISQLAHSTAIDSATEASAPSNLRRSTSAAAGTLAKLHSPYGRRRGTYNSGGDARTTKSSYSTAATQRSIPTTVVVGATTGKDARNDLADQGFRAATAPTTTTAALPKTATSPSSYTLGTQGTTTDSSRSDISGTGSANKIRKRADKLHSSDTLSSSSDGLTLTATNHSVINQSSSSSGSGSDSGVGSNREALAHEGSEPVVYVSDSGGYIPVTPIRSRHPQASSDYHASSHGGGGVVIGGPGVDLEQWRPELWDRDYSRGYRYNNTRVQHIEAECQDDYMKIRVGFNGSFAGLLYSAGYAYDPDCMYVNGSGRDYYEFFIQLNRCGTLGKNSHHDDSRKNPTKNFMWNTITVQYNPLIEEEFDEHFKVTCEYGYDFWKTVTFPFLDVEVATGNPVVFTLSPPECYMEIRNGYGPTGTRVSGPVRVGDPLTLIIYMRSKFDGFDIVVNDCVAHNGGNRRIQLIDDFGCPVDDKLISRFRGSWSESGVYETQVYAYMKTFRFTGSPALYIECDVRMCHGRCPSQPCHWRNLKSVSKREISNSTGDVGKKESVSDNISLFQSLRVLQEEDESAYEDELSDNASRALSNETCWRTSTFSGMLIAFSLLVCVMSASLMVACTKLRNRKAASLYDSYVNHKGQID